MKDFFSPQLLAEVLHEFSDFHDLYVAYSGGVDSEVLLRSLWQLRQSNPHLKLTAIHINHGLSPHAALWAQRCARVCGELQISFLLRQVNAAVKTNQHSPEEIARKLRYQEFATILPAGALLLTAHHADDQAETVLLQLFRGAGPKGLAAMPRIMDFAKGKLLRPLLQFSRESLLAYAREEQLQWIEDESNTNTSFDRNFLRHIIFPEIKKRWPGILAALTRVARHCADADTIMQDMAQQDLLLVKTKAEEGCSNSMLVWKNDFWIQRSLPHAQVMDCRIVDAEKYTLSVAKILTLSQPRRANVLRFWLQQMNLPTPSTKKMQQIMEQMLASRLDAAPFVTWCGAQIRRYQDAIFALSPLSSHDPTLQLIWDLKNELILPNNLGVLRVTFLEENLAQTFRRDYATLTVKFRCGGEKLSLPGRKHTHSLKKLFQEWQVPPWLRDRIPLIFHEDQLLVVVGFAYSTKWDKRVLINLGF